MPEITLFGWFHTVVGVLALLIGFYTLARHTFIEFSRSSGRAYLTLTLIAAASALAIYKHGGFGVAHWLAVLTIVAVLVGLAAEKAKFLGRFSRYLQAASYTATLLFHMIPAITDGLMRLPVDAPLVSELADPLLQGFYRAFLVGYLVIVAWQFFSIRRSSSE